MVEYKIPVKIWPGARYTNCGVSFDLNLSLKETSKVWRVTCCVVVLLRSYQILNSDINFAWWLLKPPMFPLQVARYCYYVSILLTAKPPALCPWTHLQLKQTIFLLKIRGISDCFWNIQDVREMSAENLNSLKAISFSSTYTKIDIRQKKNF